MSTAKQALTAMYARFTMNHDCRDKLRFKPETHKTNDNYIYSFDATTKTYTVYLVQTVKNDELVVKKITCAPYSVYDIPMSHLGIFRLCRVEQEQFTIPMEIVMGKCIVYDDFVITIPTEIIMD